VPRPVRTVVVERLAHAFGISDYTGRNPATSSSARTATAVVPLVGQRSRLSHWLERLVVEDEYARGWDVEVQAHELAVHAGCA